ncbi:hypothetical protein [Actinomadura coerulea]|uniref:hypothetical protein n=1 Tax=Actinomadura coerulea TaxID=46159 RepID=UPI00342B2123
MRSGITQNNWIVLGGIHLLNQTAPHRPSDPIVLVQVPPQEVCSPSTTVVIRWETLGPCPVTALTVGGGRIQHARIDGAALFPDAIAGEPLRQIVGPAAAPGLVPLCYLAQQPSGAYHAFAQIRFYAEDACFVRTTPEPIGEGPAEALDWLEPMLAAHAASALRLNNHLRYFRTHFAGTELEYKYNLPSTVDIWATSLQLLKTLRHGGLADFRPEYREEFQINYFDNHMFDITGPAAERGYASFIPAASGKYILKRKWFTEDSFARREQIFPDIDISPDEFSDHLRSKLGLEVRPLPPFRRVRYDIQCESMRTGHVLGIFIDRCSLLNAPDTVLSQCELEYRRSRNILPHDAQEVLSDMEHVDRWLVKYLADLGMPTRRTFYSKLSFLRDVAVAHQD